MSFMFAHWFEDEPANVTKGDYERVLYHNSQLLEENERLKRENKVYQVMSQIRTNAGRVRSMSTDELAKFLNAAECPGELEYGHAACKLSNIDSKVNPTIICEECWRKWLWSEP